MLGVIRHPRIRRIADAYARGESERGAIIVLVALATTFMFGMAALGVDLSRLFDERGRVQNAADHAAVTAAHAYCVLGRTSGQATGAGVASASDNGYDNNGTTNAVTVSWVSGTRFKAVVTSTIESGFAAVVGWQTLDASASASAECTHSINDGPGAVFAGGDTCAGYGKRQFDVTGQDQTVLGGAHSNGNMYIGSAPNHWTNYSAPTDPVTYAATLDANQAGNQYDPGYPASVAAKPWPAGWAPSDVPARLAKYKAIAQANGTYYTQKVTEITTDGVIYTTHPDGMDISNISGTNRTITLVAESGPIKISASDKNLAPHTDGVLIFSGKMYTGIDQCDKFTVAASGSNSSWGGLMWGPGGLVEFSGSNLSVVNGSLMGWAIKLNGSNISITNNPSTFPGPPQVLLVE